MPAPGQGLARLGLAAPDAVPGRCASLWPEGLAWEKRPVFFLLCRMRRSSRQSVSICLGSNLFVQEFCKIIFPVTANRSAQRPIMIASRSIALVPIGGFCGRFELTAASPVRISACAHDFWVLGECPERQRGRTVNPLAMPS